MLPYFAHVVLNLVEQSPLWEMLISLPTLLRRFVYLQIQSGFPSSLYFHRVFMREVVAGPIKSTGKPWSFCNAIFLRYTHARGGWVQGLKLSKNLARPCISSPPLVSTRFVSSLMLLLPWPVHWVAILWAVQSIQRNNTFELQFDWRYFISYASHLASPARCRTKLVSRCHCISLDTAWINCLHDCCHISDSFSICYTLTPSLLTKYKISVSSPVWFPSFKVKFYCVNTYQFTKLS